MRRGAAARTLALLAAGAISCRPAPPPVSSPRPPGSPRVLVLDDGVKLGADGRLLSLVELPGYDRRNPAWDGARITLAGARGETVAFQIVVQSGPRELRDVDVTVSELRGEGGGVVAADRFSRFRAWYVRVTVPSTSPAGSAGPGEYPDPLVPAATPDHGLPVRIPAGRSQAVWIDLAIPRDAGAGKYRGEVRVAAAGEPLARLELTLEVHGFELPRERHLPWRTGYGGWQALPERLGIPAGSAEWLALERDLYRLAWEGHRIAPTTHYSWIQLPSQGAGDALTVDWADFDRRFGPYLDGSAFSDGVPLNVFSLPMNLQVSRGWPVLPATVPAAVERTLVEPRRGRRFDPATLTAAARLIGRHWDERGWRLEDAFVYVADEPPPDRYEDIRRACLAIRAGDPRIRTAVAFYTELAKHPREIVERFAGLVTAWDLAGDYADLRILAARRAAGDRVGIYQGGEPFQGGEALDDDGLALVTWPWIAWRYGLDALFLYNMTEWNYFRLDRVPGVPWADGKREIWENPLNQSWPTNSQGVLVYPGAYVGIRGVVPSVRLKEVRRGMQDYEYLWLAAQRGRRDLADATARRLVPRALHEAGAAPGGLGPRGAWERDPRAWDEARRALAAAIEAGGR